MKQICDVVKNVPLFTIADSWLAKRKSGFIFIVGFIVGYSGFVSVCSYSLCRIPPLLILTGLFTDIMFVQQLIYCVNGSLACV